jgi:hypothetical protein
MANKKYYKLITLVLFVLHLNIAAQNNRLNTHNTVGWYAYFGTFKVGAKSSIHTEYQLRRTPLVSQWQQGLLRVGYNHQFNKRVLGRVGYALAETYAYGDLPINGLGKNFTEHRFYQMLQLQQKEGRLDISHRFMLEQRLVGRYTNANLTKEDEYPLLHRARYMLRIQLPINKKEITNGTTYVAAYNEIFIGFGKNVNANIFDQNRIGVLVGHRFNNTLRIEAGYLNQVLQFGRLVNNQSVFQNNNGVILNTNFNFDVTKNKNK